ncbi:MAG: SMP-30/gluconolactonase/LRE family protein [Bacteroidota bacterium]
MMNYFRRYFLITACLPFFLACSGPVPEKKEEPIEDMSEQQDFVPTIESMGEISRLDPDMDQLIPTDAVIEVLAEGFVWSEGPLWVPQLNGLIFSDIPPNRIYKWTEAEGISLYLTPSGYTSDMERGGEVGSNGLIMDAAGNLVLCQHGDRRMVRMDAPWDAPAPDFTPLADQFEGKKLNSPNDAVFRSNGDLYFTDPPYGLEKQAEDPARELDFQGVYRVDEEGVVHVVTKELSRPNGLAFSPDEKTLYVANSDPARAIWMAYDVAEDGSLDNGRVFFDATQWVGQEKGLPDGMKVTPNGYIFATGPGGVLVFDAEGKHLGTIKTGQATSNCAFGNDGQYLYMTADDYLCRIKLTI